MPTATPTLALPYPVGGDNAAGPAAFQALAERAEALFAYTASGRISAVRQGDGSILLDLVDDTIGVDKLSSNALKAVGGVTPAADRFPYFTGVDTADLAELSAFIRAFMAADDALAARDALGIGSVGFELVDSLPVDPEEGEQVFFQNADMAAVGVIWHLRYEPSAAGSYKWQMAGGTELQSFLAGEVSTSASTYQNLGGPQVVLPLSGDYDLAYGAVTESDDVMISPQIGATPASDTDSAKSISGLSAMRRKTGLAGGSSVILRYKLHEIGSSEAPDTVWNRWLRARPVRVG